MISVTILIKQASIFSAIRIQLAISSFLLLKHNNTKKRNHLLLNLIIECEFEMWHCIRRLDQAAAPQAPSTYLPSSHPPDHSTVSAIFYFCLADY
ncbi:hypothetical protein BpHYR1_049367 [Brachionus plicatilis]|uniref:Uncharacterized protein n=1 Tax=Brachionus plicatilis TaxID=10195 RepID=A0A3M7SQY6_BRAPC|nr:hypothetical protein BpHYR1_049367 [Brachionus plicatilis]